MSATTTLSAVADILAEANVALAKAQAACDALVAAKAARPTRLVREDLRAFRRVCPWANRTIPVLRDGKVRKTGLSTWDTAIAVVHFGLPLPEGWDIGPGWREKAQSASPEKIAYVARFFVG